MANCTSNELFQNVLDDHAVGAFSGRILVKEGAQKTAAFQTNRNLCATREVRMYSKPQLEIYADDVKCSHGMTTGQLDENALFYMRSRGIPLSEARMMLSVAFTSDVIDHVRLDALKDRLHKLVENVFAENWHVVPIAVSANKDIIRSLERPGWRLCLSGLFCLSLHFTNHLFNYAVDSYCYLDQ